MTLVFPINIKRDPLDPQASEKLNMLHGPAYNVSSSKFHRQQRVSHLPEMAHVIHAWSLRECRFNLEMFLGDIESELYMSQEKITHENLQEISFRSERGKLTDFQ